jgi:hypothetical protein
MPLAAPPILELYRRQARDAKDLVESWPAAQPDPTRLARDVDDVIADAAVNWPALVEKSYHREWDRAVTGTLDERTRGGEFLFDLWDAFTDALQSLRDLAGSLVSRGHSVHRLPDLDAAIDKLHRNRPRAYDNWPWFRPEETAAAEAQIARGEYVTTEDLLREVQDRLARKNAG